MHDVQVPINTIHKTLSGFGAAKKIDQHAAEQIRPDVAQTLGAWRAEQLGSKVARLYAPVVNVALQRSTAVDAVVNALMVAEPSDGRKAIAQDDPSKLHFLINSVISITIATEQE